MLGLGRALGETIAILALIISPSYLIRPRIVERGANSIGAHDREQLRRGSGPASASTR